MLILSILLSTFSFAATAVQCGEENTTVHYKYCITKDDSSSSKDILFYLHGGGDNEKSWNSFSDPIYAAWKNSNFPAPIVINISFGDFWLLVNKNATPNSGLLNLFLDQIMPKMENLAIQKPATKRYIMGASMGGFNTIQVLMNAPERFVKAAAICPAIVNLSPWANDNEILTYAKRTGADFDLMKAVGEIARAYSPNEEQWNAQIDPIQNVRNKWKNISYPTLIAGNIDDRNFFEGAQIFAKLAKNTRSPVEWQEWRGGHCELNSKSLADFISKNN